MAFAVQKDVLQFDVTVNDASLKKSKYVLRYVYTMGPNKFWSTQEYQISLGYWIKVALILIHFYINLGIAVIFITIFKMKTDL